MPIFSPRFTYGVYKQNSKLVCRNLKMPNNGVPVDFPSVYGTLNENSLGLPRVFYNGKSKTVCLPVF